MLKHLLGDPNARVVRKLQPLINRTNALEREFEGLDADALAGTTAEFRERLASQHGAQQHVGGLDDLLPEAFAAAREAARRTLGQRHYDVQLTGGVVLHRGQIAEMRTGEGKTLTATLAVYLNALTGKGVHVVTVNDYLARRDCAWMGQVYAALGMTVACLNHEQAYVYDSEVRSQKSEVRSDSDLQPPTSDRAAADAVDHARDLTGAFRVAYDYLRPVSRREAYLCDITYGTNNEFGFDYLRDNMVARVEDMVQRGHHYAIVDEVDSILIDEARTPLIISAPAEESTDQYRRFAQIVQELDAAKDYAIDEKLRAVALTEEGIAHVERLLGVENVYAQGTAIVHQLEQALRAATLYHRDKEYVVKPAPTGASGDGEVIIVDEFTGRLMHGRRYSEGLHQAIEAKEGVTIQRESQTLATITFQNYFRLYAKLAGMTGTAATEAEEFAKIYGLDVVRIPTHRPMIRHDGSDRIYRTEAAKLQAVAVEVKERHAKGQPVLLGTISIEKNEQLHALLDAAGVPHTVLNAKQHEHEGEIIAQAGRHGAVTLATNMAGRGVDVILGGNPSTPEEQDAVKQLGGLYVIGTARHESRRIDNQLRGRSGRQGDPGSTQFFVSLEDDLMRIFGGERLQRIMVRLGVPDDVPIENRVVSKQIEAAQRKVEHHHFDTRKHLLEYDDVLNKHREVIYRKRREVLDGPDPVAVVDDMVEREAERLVAAYTPGEHTSTWDLDGLEQATVALGVQRARTPDVEEERSVRGSTSGVEEEQSDGKHPMVRSAPGKLSAAESRTTLIEQLVHAARTSITALRERVEEGVRGAGGKTPEVERASSPGVEEERSDGKTPGVRRASGVEEHAADVEERTRSTPFQSLIRSVVLRAIDQAWIEHLDAIDHLRHGIGLRGYGQRDPLIEYKREAYRLFTELLALIQQDVVRALTHAAPAMAAAESVFARRQVQLSGAAKEMERGRSMGFSPSSAEGERAGEGTRATAVPHRYADAQAISAPASGTPRVGRNDPCPCGAVKADGRPIKYKHCHGRSA